MVQSAAIAIAAHLHVLLRRKTGRVTDTEWMADNADYAREIVRFAREKAATDGHTELLPLVEKLEALIPQMGMAPRKPLLEAAADKLRTARVSPPPEPGSPYPSGFADSAPPSGFLESAFNSRFGQQRKPDEDEDPASRYVGGIR